MRYCFSMLSSAKLRRGRLLALEISTLVKYTTICTTTVFNLSVSSAMFAVLYEKSVVKLYENSLMLYKTLWIYLICVENPIFGNLFSQHDGQHDTQNDTQHDTEHDTQHNTQHDTQHDTQHGNFVAYWISDNFTSSCCSIYGYLHKIRAS